MEMNVAVLITGFLFIIRQNTIDYRAAIRRTVENHSLEITAWDIDEACQLLAPSENWDAEQEELRQILGI